MIKEWEGERERDREEGEREREREREICLVENVWGSMHIGIFGLFSN